MIGYLLVIKCFITELADDGVVLVVGHESQIKPLLQVSLDPVFLEELFSLELFLAEITDPALCLGENQLNQTMNQTKMMKKIILHFKLLTTAGTLGTLRIIKILSFDWLLKTNSDL